MRNVRSPARYDLTGIFQAATKSKSRSTEDNADVADIVSDLETPSAISAQSAVKNSRSSNLFAMKNWSLFFRRTHLYLGMLLLPWVAMYALSTVVFNHREHFLKFRPTDPQYLPLWEKDYAIDVPSGTDALRETARRIIVDSGLSGGFGVQRQGQRLAINIPNFFQPTRLTYEIEGKKLRAEKRKTSWVEVLTRLHERTGYGRGGFLNNLWAMIVDVFCVTTLVWIATGLYLWWNLPGVRRWGFITIGGGVATLLILLRSL
jgi:hypothetical protein